MSNMTHVPAACLCYIYSISMSCGATSKLLNLIKSNCVWNLIKSNRTWTKLFNAPIAAADVHRKHVLEPGDLWVRVSAGGTQHGGSSGLFNHLQLGTHIDGGEAMGDLVLWKCTKAKIFFSASRDTEQEIKNQTDKTKAVNKVFIKRFWQNSFWIAVRVVECIRPVELARTERSMKESKYISGATGRTRVTKPQDLCKSRIYYWGMADQVLFGFQIGLGKKIKSCLWLIIIAGLLPGTGSLRFRQRTDSCNLPLGTHA